MNIRPSAFAGAFYDAGPQRCRLHAQRLLDGAQLPTDLDTIVGGIVPHAGWVYSGPLAAATVRAVFARGDVGTVVLFGADHRGGVRKGEVYESGFWQTPLGEAAIDEEVASAILAAGGDLRANAQAHAQEHSLEVLVPLLQIANPNVRIVPIAVPPLDAAVAIGQAVGRVLAAKFPHVRVIGSTDLTHHGGHFPAPGGCGEKGVQWAEKNDRRMIDLLTAMAAEKIVPESDERMNACGAGAAAATVAACRELGARTGRLLAYDNSYRIVHAKDPYELDETTVGYASVVFG